MILSSRPYGLPVNGISLRVDDEGRALNQREKKRRCGHCISLGQNSKIAPHPKVVLKNPRLDVSN